MILSKVYEDAERRLERNEITLGEFERLVDIEVIEPKQGEWIDTEERETLIGSIDCETPRKYRLPKCSLCGKEFGTPAYKYRFCPNCGASMREREGE